MIKPEILTMLAKASGEAYAITKGQWSIPDLGLDAVKLLEEAGGTIRGFLAYHKEGLVIAIKGTASAKDLLVDGEFLKRPFRGSMVHEGFLYEHDQIRKRLPRAELNSTIPIYVTGHSLGGAVASLLAHSLKVDYPELDIRVATFGCPYVGDHAFSKAFNSALPVSLRIVHNYDIVPRLNWLGSHHVDHLLHLDDEGKKIGITRGILTQIGHWCKLVASDIGGIALKDHHEAYYVAAVSKYSERLAAKEEAKAG